MRHRGPAGNGSPGNGKLGRAWDPNLRHGLQVLLAFLAVLLLGGGLALGWRLARQPRASATASVPTAVAFVPPSADLSPYSSGVALCRAASGEFYDDAARHSADDGHYCWAGGHR